MALTQLQLLESLQETLRWFERELQWGVPASELLHLVGRIGEIYTALYCGGQLAVNSKQMGYDVVCRYGTRYSVNCVAAKTIQGEINFTRDMLEQVDRVAVLFLDVEDLEVNMVLDCAVEDLGEYITAQEGGKLILSLANLIPQRRDRSELVALRELLYKDYLLRELETGDVEIELYGNLVDHPRSYLKKLAVELGVSFHSGMGDVRSGRMLGIRVMDAIQERGSSK